MKWDLVIIFFTIYNCISIPYEVSFSKGFSDHITITILEHTIDFLFFVDILFNFRTTYINEKTGFEIGEPKKIGMEL